MEVFDKLDKGLSQSRGLTLFELCKSQFDQFLFIKSVLYKNATPIGVDVESGDSTINPTANSKQVESECLQLELLKNINEALRCLNSELPESHSGKTQLKLTDMKRQLSDLFKA